MQIARPHPSCSEPIYPALLFSLSTYHHPSYISVYPLFFLCPFFLCCLFYFVYFPLLEYKLHKGKDFDWFYSLMGPYLKHSIIFAEWWEKSSARRGFKVNGRFIGYWSKQFHIHIYRFSSFTWLAKSKLLLTHTWVIISCLRFAFQVSAVDAETQ